MAVYLYNDPNQAIMWYATADPAQTQVFEETMDAGGIYYVMIGEGQGSYTLEIK